MDDKNKKELRNNIILLLVIIIIAAIMIRSLTHGETLTEYANKNAVSQNYENGDDADN